MILGNLLFLLVLHQAHSVTLTPFDTLKKMIIEDKQVVAMKHRFYTNGIMDTYFFSSSFDTIEVERITGLRKVPIPMLSSLLTAIKYFAVSNHTPTIDLQLVNNEWIISYETPTFEVSIEYNSNSDNGFFGNIKVTSSSYLTLENNNINIICRVNMGELYLNACGITGGRIKEDLVQHVGSFGGLIKEIPCEGVNSVLIADIQVYSLAECVDDSECTGGTCTMRACCTPDLPCIEVEGYFTCPCEMVCRKRLTPAGFDDVTACHFIDFDDCHLSHSDLCPGTVYSNCAFKAQKYCLSD